MGEAVALVVATVLLAAPGTPTVTGPRVTDSTRPTYRFSAPRAVRFHCAFDTPKLHACTARYSQQLAVGAHVLRVQALGRTGKKSRVTSVRVRVAAKMPTIPLAATIAVGHGAGAPAVGAGSVWVPNTVDGTLSRVDATTNTVTATIKYSAGGLPGDYYDSAAFGDGSVWVASDEHATVTRVDPATNKVVATITVSPRPAQITVTNDAVWVAHFLQPEATRIDPATNAPTAHQLGGAASLTGAAGDGPTLWLLANQPQTLFHLDSTSAAEIAHADVTPSAAPTRSFLASWWVAAGGGAVWVTHPNQNCVTRTDPATGAITATIPVTEGRLFGVAAGSGAVWAVTDAALVRIDPATNAVTGQAPFPKASPVGFTGVVVGEGAVWATNYDRGELYRVAL